MRSTGIVRKVDELGRIVLPIELRRTLDIEERDSIEIFVEENSIILRKYNPGCTICGSVEDVVMFKGKCLCAECIGELQDTQRHGR